MKGLEKLELSAQPEALEQISAWLRDLKARYALPEQTIGELNIILEELLMNIIVHAAPKPPATGPIPVRIEAEVSGGLITLCVKDESLPFDPLSRPKPDLSLALGDRPIGGLGLHLVREMSDSFRYAFEHGWNVSRIGKSIRQENPE